MARIIYAVAGEGFGHASRAHLIGQRFLDAGHDVLFVSSHRGLAYLRQYYGPQVQEIFGLTFDYSRGYVDPVATVGKNLGQLTYANSFNRRLFEGVYRPFRPDLVVTDFEPFSAWWAWRNRVPFLSIGHEHMLILCRLEHQWRNLVPRLTSAVVTRFHYLGARAYVVLNFFHAPLKSRPWSGGPLRGHAVLAPLVVRPAVTKVTASDAGHVVVYSTTGTHEDRLREVLSRFPDQRFHVYGFRPPQGAGNSKFEARNPNSAGNCVFKERSLEGFLADVASARGVIASAGSSLLAECLYLRKKMLLLPLPGQYEQFLNAYYAEKLGLAQWTWQLDPAGVSRFLEGIEEPLPQNGSRVEGAQCVEPDAQPRRAAPTRGGAPRQGRAKAAPRPPSNRGPQARDTGRILWPDNEQFFAVLKGVLANLDLPVRVSI